MPVLALLRSRPVVARAYYYPAATILCRATETDGLPAPPARATGAFHKSKVVALAWARSQYGPPPTNRELDIEGLERVPGPRSGHPTLQEESAGLAFLVGAVWYLRGVRPTRPVAFTGRLDERTREIAPVGGVQEKADAARRAGVAWTVTVGEKRSKADCDGGLRIVRIPASHWLAWLHEAEDFLRRRCRIWLEPALRVWDGWLEHLERLSDDRDIEKANGLAVKLHELSQSLPTVRSAPRWSHVVFRISWAKARARAMGGAPRQAEGFFGQAAAALQKNAISLGELQRFRLEAQRLVNAVDLGLPRPPDRGGFRWLLRAGQDRRRSEDVRVRALGAVAHWRMFQGCQRAGRYSARLFCQAEEQLRAKRDLEAAGRNHGAGLLRADGDLACLLSLVGRWDEVPRVLAGLLRMRPPRGGDEPREVATSWRFQAFYAVRWLAFARLTDRDVPSDWGRWWRRWGRQVRDAANAKDEVHVVAGLERSATILEGPDVWTHCRQRALQAFFERLAHRAETYEHDELIAWGLAEALSWLARRWRLPWGPVWAEHAGNRLDRLRWYARHRGLVELHRRLARGDPAHDVDAAGFQAILRAVLY